jgi:L-threonylcarbamoyladenylate synthase
MLAGMAEAVSALAAGGVVAYPTEAVFGLGCLPDRTDALERLLAMKSRDPDQGLILIGASYDQLRPFVDDLDPEVEARVLASWPGAVSWVLPARQGLHQLVTGGLGTVCVRVPDHAQARELCATLGSAITSTSANRRGEPPARDAAAVVQTLGELVDLVLDGPTGGRESPSEIRDGLSGESLRPGGTA